MLQRQSAATAPSIVHLPLADADTSAVGRTPRRQSQALARAVKRTIDIVGALAFFVLFGPLYLLVALAVLVSMGRPVHYWQNRLGNGGRFRFYKFRSMVRDSDSVLDEFLSRNDMARTEWEIGRAHV